MISPRRSFATGLAALGLVLSGLPATASAASPIPTPPPAPVLCQGYMATLADCQNPVTLCAKAVRNLAKTDPNAVCNRLIQDAAEDAAAGMSRRTVVVPRTLKANGQTVEPDAATKSVAFAKDDPNTREMSGLSSFFLGSVHRARTYFPATTAYASKLKNSRAQLRNGWNASGNVINSCAEYVFEKYYDYSVFEDAIASAGSDHRAIYSVAYAIAPLGGSTPASAIGTRGVSSPQQRGKDGTLITPAITFPSGAPKNQFFTVPPPSQGKVSVGAGSVDRVSIIPGVLGGAIISLKNLSRPLNLYGTALDTARLNTLAQGAHYYNESWAWHRSMSQRNAGVLDEEMYALEQSQTDFTGLLRQRGELVASIQEEVAHQYRPLPGTLQAGGSSQGASLSDDQENPLIPMFYTLASLDGAIDAALVQAQARGCLTFQSGSAPAPCDWSPKRFVQRVMDLYQVPREQAFQKCSDYTNDDFASLKSRALVQGSVNYPAQDYTTQPSRLETYFPRRDEYLRALSLTVGALLDPHTLQPRLKWESGDSYDLGDETFGATAEYNVSAAVNNVLQSDCSLSPEARGHFAATGRALSKSVNLITADVVVTNKKADIDLDVLDNTVSLLDVHENLTEGEFNLVSGSKEKQGTLVDVSTTFIVVVVPVTLGAKVAGVVGLNYSLVGQHHVTTASPCEVTSLSVAGRLEPYARVDGELYAGVDLFIVEAGIKGRLQLVHASVPLQAEAGVFQSGGELGLKLAGRADLKFTFLAGSISAYVEVGIWPLEEEFEETLVSWDGIHDDMKLFDKSVTAPLAAIQDLL
ncbi:hypothetical protein [Corallococcus carmarthensis]|uniref:Uncharacterized protein n=1 Tax=Corallococcus carmarthensis TaxID=2316728 RepID=A0A3A8K1G0_9BACT|nr:hypothetical protein [Corallococcus carmarthensis]NOK19687.1 hypothetical protein [Corallococcus carmarthensis]RKH01306.1 hypothetical protein D7X32_20770 [Corallococcus carmarthensis]